MNRYTGRTRQRTSSHTSAKVKKGTFVLADEPGAWPSSLKELEELGYATRVQAQPVTIDDFQNVLLHFRPTDYSADSSCTTNSEVGDKD